MDTHEQLKEMVRQKYSQIALQDKSTNQTSCCGCGSCSDTTGNSFHEVCSSMNEDYAELKGYIPDADLGLGCGLPTQFAQIKKGNTVIDLGSGAGNDCFIARAEVGPEGRIIGIDFTPEMIEKARKNAEKLGFNNVEFILGDIEKMPLSDSIADVVISNCVLNLVPNKKAVFQEIYRVLKPGGHFSISDIVLQGTLPEPIRHAAEMYAGCISGAIQQNDYLALIQATGFLQVKVQKERPIVIPENILRQYLSTDQITAFYNSSNRIVSITVYAEKPY
ncbi:MAG: arsenite methyltransferase [Thermoflavifilum sp.]|nr:arsenite methyltransferase [Thermoflavifilum sp.]